MTAWAATISRLNEQGADPVARSVGTPPGFASIASTLPPLVDAKLAALVQERHDAHALVSSMAERRDSLRMDKLKAETRWRQLTDPDLAVMRLIPASNLGQPVPPEAREHAALVDARGRWTKATEELAKLDALHQERSERWAALGAVVSACERYVANYADSIEAYDATHVSLPKKGETPEAAIARLRLDIERLRAELSTVRTAPIPAAEAKRLARAQVEELAERGRPDVAGLLAHGGAITFAQQALSFSTPTVKADDFVTASIPTADALATVAWLNRTAMLKAVDALIDEQQDGQALTAEAHHAREVELLDALLSAERCEEAAVLASNGSIPRRPDADPRAILGIVGPSPEGK